MKLSTAVHLVTAICTLSTANLQDQCEENADGSGSNCVMPCPSGCNVSANGKRYCWKDSGTCLGNCIVGRYTDDCSEDCLKICHLGICNKDDGECTHGEISAQITSPPHLQDQCEENADGSGSNCVMPCPSGCNVSANGKRYCWKDSGTCLGNCIVGRYTDDCSEDCLKNCHLGICNKDDGECTHGEISAQITSPRSNAACNTAVFPFFVMLMHLSIR